MTERDPRLKQCASCDNWSGKSNIVGKCAICMNGKGFNVSCDCEIDGCFACEYEDDEDEDEEIEGLDDTTEHDREMARVLEEAKINVIDPPEKEMRYGWWISFLLMHRKDYTPILGNCFVAMPFDSVDEVDNFNLLAMSAYAQSGESPHTHTSTILNFKRMENMDFEISIPKSAYSQSEEKVEEKENVVSMFGKQES